jgi:hypothetical protein
MNTLSASPQAGPQPAAQPDLIGVEAALRRAGAQALKLARQTGTPCWVWRDGKMVDLTQESDPAADAAPDLPASSP